MRSTEILKVLNICVVTMLAVATVFMNQSIFLEIAESFNIGPSQARYAFSIVSLFYSATFLILGPFIDTFNLPKIAITGIALLAITVFCSSYLTVFNYFIVSMVVMGICAAMIPASLFPYMASISPDTDKGLYVGSIVASSTMGVILGRASVGLMSEAMCWQNAYRVIALLLSLFLVTSFITLLDAPNQQPIHTKKNTRAYADSLRQMFRPQTFLLLIVGAGLFFGFLGMVTFLTYRLNNPPFNYTAGQIGWISFAGITALVAPLSGKFSQKTDPINIIFPSLLMALLSCQILGWFDSVAVITLGLLLLFLSVYTCQPLVFLLIGQTVSRDFIGGASSLYIFFCIGGGSLSSFVLGPVWRYYGWPGIVWSCSLSLLTSLLVLSIFVYYMAKRGILVDAV